MSGTLVVRVARRAIGGTSSSISKAGFSRASRLAGKWALLVLPCMACQRYVPLSLTPPPVGRDVRVSLNDDAAATSFARVGARVSQAEGRLLFATDSTLAIGVSAVKRTNGIEDDWSGDTVVFRRAQVAGVEQRRISRSRTFLTLGALLAAGIVAHQRLQRGDQVVVGQPPPHGGN